MNRSLNSSVCLRRFCNVYEIKEINLESKFRIMCFKYDAPTMPVTTTILSVSIFQFYHSDLEQQLSQITPDEYKTFPNK